MDLTWKEIGEREIKLDRYICKYRQKRWIDRNVNLDKRATHLDWYWDPLQELLELQLLLIPDRDVAELPGEAEHPVHAPVPLWHVEEGSLSIFGALILTVMEKYQCAE